MKQLFLSIAFYSVCASWAAAQTTTRLLESGGTGAKTDLVIIGDGFQAGQQNIFNDYVQNTIMAGMFSEGVFQEILNAFNISRVNVNSTDAGVTQVDNMGVVTIARNTVLGYRFSGSWARCWMEPGPNTNGTRNTLLNALTPGWELVIVVLNEPGGGGCRRGNVITVTLGVGWDVVSHEMGHMVGNLGDEYVNDTLTYAKGEPGNANLTINTNRNTVKWADFIDPATPVLTTAAGVSSADSDAGIFLGGGGNYPRGMYRPALNDRMSGNTPAFCPVCYNRLHESVDAFHEHTFQHAIAGDFNGDGRTEIALHNANSLALYRSKGNALEVSWIATGEIPVWDDFKPGDLFYPADFDGDGKDDLFVFNYSDWLMPYFAMLKSNGTGFDCIRMFSLELPGWDVMKPHDQFYVADFNGDNKDDILVFNGRDWNQGYLELLQSTGNDLAYVKRFDGYIPGWDLMKASDNFHIGDFNGDKQDDVYISNLADWSVPYLGMLQSTGNDLVSIRLYAEELPGWDDMRPSDRFFVANFDGDRTDDLYVFNGFDWNQQYLIMLRSNGQELQSVRRFDDFVPGWDALQPNDQFYVADANGDKRDDLYAVNTADWNTEYLGILRSTGNDLAGGWQDDWIGSWNLSADDKFLVGNFNGLLGWDDIFVRNDDWFGMLRSYTSYNNLSAIYPKWIHDHRYHLQGWW